MTCVAGGRGGRAGGGGNHALLPPDRGNTYSEKLQGQAQTAATLLMFSFKTVHKYSAQQDLNKTIQHYK